MDVKLVFVLSIGIFVLLEIPNVECWRIRIRLRRVKDKVCKPLCPLACVAATSGVATVGCHLGCTALCRRKRSSLELDKNTIVVPIPRQFQLYDENHDGIITPKELSDVFDQHDEKINEAFMYADANADGQLTEEEFINGPFVFEQDETDDGSDDKDIIGEPNPSIEE